MTSLNVLKIYIFYPKIHNLKINKWNSIWSSKILKQRKTSLIFFSWVKCLTNLNFLWINWKIKTQPKCTLEQRRTKIYNFMTSTNGFTMRSKDRSTKGVGLDYKLVWNWRKKDSSLRLIKLTLMEQQVSRQRVSNLQVWR